MAKSLYTWDIIKAIKEQPHLLGILCGYKDLLPIHSDWIHSIHDSSAGKDVSLMASRASYKSTAIVIIGVMYRLLRNKNETICVTRKSYGAAVDVTRTIMNLMESPLIHELFRFAWGADKNGDIPSKFDWKFNIRKEGVLNLSVRTSQSPEASITAIGLDTSLTGKHYDFAILDDVVTIQDRLYQSEREYTKLIVSEIRANITKKTGYTAIIGTPYHSDDCLAQIEAEGVPMQKFPYQMLPFILPEEIEKARKAQSDALFKCNYELDYKSSEDMLFADPFMGRWDKPHAKEVKAHIDAGFAGEDRSALTIAAKLPDGRINVVGFTSTMHIVDWMPFVFQKLQQYNAHMLYMESNADKGLVLDKFVQHPLAKSWPIQPMEYRETQNKQIKIATVVKDVWLKLVFAEETEPEYMLGVVDWNENTKTQDDAPDSLASLMRESGFATGYDYMSLYNYA